jgi:hypothetical protein
MAIKTERDSVVGRVVTALRLRLYMVDFDPDALVAPADATMSRPSHKRLLSDFTRKRHEKT